MVMQWTFLKDAFPCISAVRRQQMGRLQGSGSVRALVDAVWHSCPGVRRPSERPSGGSSVRSAPQPVGAVVCSMLCGPQLARVAQN